MKVLCFPGVFMAGYMAEKEKRNGSKQVGYRCEKQTDFVSMKRSLQSQCLQCTFYYSGSPPFEKLTEVVTKRSLLKDVKQISGVHATSSLEAFHSVQNHFATKRLAFSYHGMTSR